MPLRFVVFLSLLTLLVVSGHVYLYRRLVRDVSVHRGARRAGALLLALLAALVLGGRLLATLLPPGAAALLGSAGYLWMGTSLYLVLALLLLDGLRRAAPRLEGRAGPAPLPQGPASGAADGRAAASAASAEPPAAPPAQAAGAPRVDGAGEADGLARRAFLSRTVAGGALVLGGGVSAFGTWRAYHPSEVRELVVPLAGLPKALEGLTLVHLSDLHVGPSIRERFMRALLSQVRGLRPDVLVVTGDLVDGRVADLGRFVATLGEVPARFGRYFVTGNHEYYSGVEAWCAALPRMGVTPLRNRHVAVGEAGGVSFDLAGVDDWSSRGSPGGYDLAGALAGRRPDRATVLLAHQPREFEEAVAAGVGLQLSGHTHAGQLFPSTLVTPLVWRHDAGHFRHGAGHLYVSRGTGFWGPPMRVGSPPEVVKVVLTAA
jgi:predicted MPP superfamily phosphohydrolase